MLEFDDPVSITFATVVMTNDAGASVATRQRANAPTLRAKVTKALSPDMALSDYRVASQVTSNEAHPVSGQWRVESQNSRRCWLGQETFDVGRGSVGTALNSVPQNRPGGLVDPVPVPIARTVGSSSSAQVRLLCDAKPERISDYPTAPASLSPRCAVSSIGRAADS